MRALFFSFALMGCGSVVMETVAQLERLSPLDADPGQIAVAIDLPDGFAIYSDSAIMRMSVTRKDLGESRAEEFVLQQSGAEWTVFRVAQVDLARLAEIQNLAKNWETEYPKATKGSFSVGALPCVKNSDADRSETFSISIQLAADAPFKPLVRNAKVSSILSRSELSELPICPLETPKPL